MTPGCTTEACDSRDNLAALGNAGIDVVAISPDKPDKLAAFRDKESLTFPLLADPDRSVLTAYGAYGEKMMYGKPVVGVIRSTFVVDEGGRIERAMYGARRGPRGEAASRTRRLTARTMCSLAGVA